MRVAIAMSGGVDSSVAAALAVKEFGKGSVFGVTMKLFCYGDEEGSEKSCCSLDAIADAAAVCKQLGIPHYVINLEKEFETVVINNFISEYANGITPNPCVRCNQFVKYEYLLTKVRELGAETLITGHYARVKKDEKGYHLLKGMDQKKDQSYFLYNLNQEQLAHVQFPIGEMEKTKTRELAKEFGLKTAEKTESQDICFVLTTTQDFLNKNTEQYPGDIVDSVGNIWGRHNGLSSYTIGQRKGLGGGFSEIMYVIGLDVGKNQVVVGAKKQLYSSKLRVKDLHWVSEYSPTFPLKCMAKIRYNSAETECVISHVIPAKAGIQTGVAVGQDSRLRGNEDVMVTFSAPQLAITPGQSVVIYENDEVLGGGIILPAETA